jgi:hypothetical protein
VANSGKEISQLTQTTNAESTNSAPTQPHGHRNEVPNCRLAETINLDERLRRTLAAAKEHIHGQSIAFNQVWRHTDKGGMSG